LQLAIARFEQREDAPHARDGVATLVGPAAVRGAAFRHDFDPRESLVANGHLQIRRLGDHGRMRAPIADASLGTEAHVLLVHHGGDHEPAVRPALRERAGGRNHRRDAAFHVLRAPAVQPAALDARLEGIGHAFDADGVEMAAEHDRGTRPAAVEHADDVRTAWHDPLQHDLQPG